MSDIIPILFHCWFQLLLWHRKGIAETWGRDCPPNSGAADHDKWVIGSGNMLICYCTIHHNLSVLSFILHCCMIYWCSSSLELLTLVLWDVIIYGANLPPIFLLWVWTVAPSETGKKWEKWDPQQKCRRHHWSKPCNLAKIYWRTAVRQYSAYSNEPVNQI